MILCVITITRVFTALMADSVAKNLKTITSLKAAFTLRGEEHLRCTISFINTNAYNGYYSCARGERYMSIVRRIC